MKESVNAIINGALGGALVGSIAALINLGMVGYAIICIDFFLVSFIIGFTFSRMKHRKRST